MYKNNSRNSSVIKGFSSLQLLCNLIEKCHAVRYYSYTQHSQLLIKILTYDEYRN